MSVVILGAGKIGSHVAKTLSEGGRDVILIDREEKSLARAKRESDIGAIQADHLSWKLLEELSENKCHLFFAATGNDETNLVASSIAKNLGFEKTIVRVQSREYLNHSKLDFGRLFFADYFICPETLAAQDLCKLLIHSGDIAVEHFAHGAIQMRTIQIPDFWDKGGLPISDLTLPNDLIAGLIRRKAESGEIILIPHGEDHILPGDQLTVVGETRVMHHLHEIFHSPQSYIRSVVLVGGSALAIHLAYFLSQQKIHVRLIEKNPTHANELARLLPNVTIINRDGRDFQLLRSEQVELADAFVSCTHYDETNLLIASMAKELGCAKSIAQVTNTQIVPILEKIGVIAALSPRVAVANRILSILDEETTLSIKSLGCDTAKIVEFKILASSKVVGIPLSDLNLPKGILIAVIESQGRVAIGKGNQVLCPDDIVIAICNPLQIPKLQGLFH